MKVKTGIVEGAQVLCLLGCIATGEAYTFQTINTLFPGANTIVITGISSTSAMTGIYTDMGEINGHHGFLDEDGLNSGGRRPYPLLFTTPKGVNNLGVVIGFYADFPAYGFLYHDGNFWAFQGPQRPQASGQPAFTNFPSVTEPQGINNLGVVVGYYKYPIRFGGGSPNPEPLHGFLYDTQAGTIETIDIPGAIETFPVAINDHGEVIGHAKFPNGSTYLFSWQDGDVAYFTLGVPSEEVSLAGLTNSGAIVGNRGTSGFIWDGLGLQVIEVPGAIFTDVTGITENFTVYGTFQDTQEETYSFIATPETARNAGFTGARSSGAPNEALVCNAASKRRVCK